MNYSKIREPNNEHYEIMYNQILIAINAYNFISGNKDPDDVVEHEDPYDYIIDHVVDQIKNITYQINLYGKQIQKLCKKGQGKCMIYYQQDEKFQNKYTINHFANLIYNFKYVNPIKDEMLDDDIFIEAMSNLTQSWLYTFGRVSLLINDYAKTVSEIFSRMTRRNYVIVCCNEINDICLALNPEFIKSVDNGLNKYADFKNYSCGRGVKGLTSTVLNSEFGHDSDKPDPLFEKFETRIIIFQTVGCENDSEDYSMFRKCVEKLIKKYTADDPKHPDPTNHVGGLHKYNKNKYFELNKLKTIF